MDNDDSSSVEAIEITANEELPDELQGRPIMQLFKRLIGNDKKQNTILSNAQIIDILQKEFNIDMSVTHELEIEIYLNIMKKFLKDWPEWDEFDKVVNSVNDLNEESKVNMLEEKYVSLKNYLHKILESAKPYAEDVVKTVNVVKEQKAATDVEMVVHCSRRQLNKLFLKYPNPTCNNTIFQISEHTPSKIQLNSLKLKSIFNWWNVGITVYLWNTVMYKMETTHKLNHILVNRKHRTVEEDAFNLLQAIHTKKVGKTSDKATLTRSAILNSISQIIDYFTSKNCSPDDLENAKTILNLIVNDLNDMQALIYIRHFYRRFLSEYPYVRYLCSTAYNEVPSKCKYELYLQETVSPRRQFSFRKCTQIDIMDIQQDWFEIECVDCSVKFPGLKSVNHMLWHFNQYHSDENDWMCVKCNLVIPMSELCAEDWQHKCIELQH